MQAASLATTRRWLVALFLSFAATLVSAAPKAAWTIVDVGQLGDGGSRATVINERGDVAGISFKDLFNHTFLYKDGQLTDIGLPPGGPGAEVEGINNRGDMVIEGNNQHVFLWSRGNWTELPFIGQPNDINNAGAIVGAYNVGAANIPHAFMYQDGIFHDLGLDGGTATVAWAINDAGTIAGTKYSNGFSTTHAFIYQNGGFKDLGTLGGNSSSAADINASGTVVGASQTADGNFVAMIYDAGGMRPLFNAPGSSSAVAVNDRGTVVGTYAQGSFMYQDGVLTNLNTLPEVQAAGWIRLFPQEINNRGWIVGFGQHADFSVTGFVLMPK
jgi:probable HAF family extracellular repeat protein